MASDDDQAGSKAGRGTEWLSKGFEELLARRAENPWQDATQLDYDLVIVGSGYGGAVALSRLAKCSVDGRPLRICLLERGHEYLRGAFANGFSELAGHVRIATAGAPAARGIATGLMDVRVGPDVHALVGNGLGGGSLINAGVMAWPAAAVFEDPRWPAEIRVDAAALRESAAALKRELGVAAAPNPRVFAKREAMARMAGEHGCSELETTIATSDGPNAQGVKMEACIGCGDCATGCNHGAKASLDLTLLVDGALHRDNVEVYCGASVLRVSTDEAGAWRLEVVHTDEKMRQREPAPLFLRAARVILAAGAFGSTEILMRSARAGLSVSPMLGERFSANGDAMAEIFDSGMEVNAVGREEEAPAKRNVGPTINRIIDLRHEADPLVVQDITIPSALRRAFEEISACANSLHLLGEADDCGYEAGGDWTDRNAVDRDKVQRSLLVAMIGHDDAIGRLVASDLAVDIGEGTLFVDWPSIREDPRFQQRHLRLAELANPPHRSPRLGGRVLANPLWQALPQTLAGVLESPRGPLMTVHPLGGCPMAADGARGVVDHLGRVFTGLGSDSHEGLVVLDGSIIPMSLGINPALSIATIADRAVRRLIDGPWGLQRVGAATRPRAERPVFRELSPDAALARKPTLANLAERLRGRLRLDLGSGLHDYDVELELRGLPIDLQELFSPKGPGRVRLDPKRSELRIFKADAPMSMNIRRRRDALYRVPLEGTLTVLRHEPTSPTGRAFRGLFAWARNRGVRDAVQGIIDGLAAPEGGQGKGFDLLGRARMAWRIATRAGCMRRFDYELQVLANDEQPEKSLPGTPARISGSKAITYEVAGNPWQQLQQIALSRFPGLPAGAPAGASLHVDLSYAEHAKVALMELSDQQDMPSALMDLASLALYFGRTLLHGHLWTFRRPDATSRATPQRLPGPLPGVPAPQVMEFVVESNPRVRRPPARARLTRYQGAARGETPRLPVLMIHGYSASGTTFAHPKIDSGGLAGFLAQRGYDAWVLDLRSSCGMPTARQRWTFEEVGYADIPLAVEHVLAATGSEELDVVAHCMGAAMLSMALLGNTDPNDPPEPYPTLRAELPKRIRSLVLSQVGPRLVMSPANIFRAYVMRYVQHYLPLAEYDFRPSESPGPGEALLDRFLASVPYPARDFAVENPLWPPWKRTPWVAARHRMDALYGRTFNLECMPESVLDSIDDFFGPMNVEMASQVIHFTKAFRITDGAGLDCYGQEPRFDQRFPKRVLSLHADANGLVDPTTEEAMRRYMGSEPGSKRRTELFPGGHQDSLIGSGAGKNFERIRQFLEES